MGNKITNCQNCGKDIRKDKHKVKFNDSVEYFCTECYESAGECELCNMYGPRKDKLRCNKCFEGCKLCRGCKQFIPNDKMIYGKCNECDKCHKKCDVCDDVEIIEFYDSYICNICGENEEMINGMSRCLKCFTDKCIKCKEPIEWKERENGWCDSCYPKCSICHEEKISNNKNSTCSNCVPKCVVCEVCGVYENSTKCYRCDIVDKISKIREKKLNDKFTQIDKNKLDGAKKTTLKDRFSKKFS